MEYENTILLGDCLEILRDMPDDSIDLIVTSPPYADQRKDIYGGIHPDYYVAWFMPRADQFLRVLKPTGSFILNIKERVVDGERHTYVLDLIIEMRKHKWFWTEEYMWHKKILILENGPTGLEITGRDCFILLSQNGLACTRIM